MKILVRESLLPIHVVPGDEIVLHYEEHIDGTLVRRIPVARKVIERAMIVDEGVVFELDDQELKALGWKDGIGGAFGERV